MTVAVGFKHEALFYSDEREFLEGTVPFVHEGVELGEAVQVAVSGPRIELMREQLGGNADWVRFIEMGELGKNPARIIPAWRDFLASSGGRAVRGIGEPVWPGRSADELVECDHHEALLNLAFESAPSFQLLCPYDSAGLEEDVLEAACRNHPGLRGRDHDHNGAAYSPPHRRGAPFSGPLAPAPDDAEALTFEEKSIGRVRRWVAEHAIAAGFGERRRWDLVVSVGELAANSVEHGGGGGIARIWHESGEEGDTVVCQVEDRGIFEDPLAGRRRPTARQLRGRGLWVANHLCDLIQIRSGADGTIARARMRAG